MYGILYRITNKIDGMSYIGQTRQSLEKRWGQHCQKSNSKNKCTYIYNAIQKYGAEFFEVEILAKANNKEELNYRETYYIKLFNSLAPNGYNLKTGGHNTIYSKESKNKISESLKGRTAWNKGIPMSEVAKDKLSHRNKDQRRSPLTEFKAGQTSPFKGMSHSEKTKTTISESKKEQIPPNKGKKCSEETKKRISESCMGRSSGHKGKKHSFESIEKISKAKKGQPSLNRKQVIDIVNGMVWESASEAADVYGIRYGTLRAYLSGHSPNPTNLRYLDKVET